jgi:hypothetical protein
MILVNQAIDRKNQLANTVASVNTYEERLERVIHLYEYVHETPILMETLEDFREDVWDKLAILEDLLLEKQQKLDFDDERDARIHTLICRAMFLIEDIRTKYWK